jgi:hypothetical protein
MMILGAGAQTLIDRSPVGAAGEPLCIYRHDTREAVVLLNRAVATLERQLKPDHPHLAAARRNLQTALSSAARPG